MCCGVVGIKNINLVLKTVFLILLLSIIILLTNFSMEAGQLWEKMSNTNTMRWSEQHFRQKWPTYYFD